MTERINKRKGSKHGVAIFGIKSPNVDSSTYLREMGLSYEHICTKGIERIKIGYNDGDKTVIDITNFINDRYQLNCVLGYGLGSHPEETETILGKLMCAAGIFTVSPEDMPENVREAASGTLEKFLKEAASSSSFQEGRHQK